MLTAVSILVSLFAFSLVVRHSRHRRRMLGELRESNDRLEAANQQLRTANEQLSASEQQLNAMDQQLHAGEQALCEREQRLRSIFIAAPVGIGTTVDRVLKQVNDSICRMTGYSSGQLLNQSARILYPTEEEYVRVGKLTYDQISREGRGTIEARWQRKDGTIIDVLLSLAPISAGDLGKGVTFAALDISSRKQAELLLQRELSFRKAIIDNAADGIAVFHDIPEFPFVRFTVWNSKMVAITGYSLERINALGWYQSLYPDPTHQQRAIARMDCVRQGENLVGEEWAIVRADGRKRTVSMSTAVVANEEERTLVLAIIQDLTDKKKAQEELRNAQRLESLGVLAGGIAHDFNNLLAGLFGYLDMARRYGNADEETRGYLDKAVSAFHKARSLTQQLLTFAKGGAPVVRIGSVAAIVEDASSLALSGSNVKCAIDSDPDLWSARVDEHQIGQVIGDLLINARQSMAGGGTVEVRMCNRQIGPEDGVPLANGPYVVIDIKDHGIGIPSEHLSRIFDPFFSTKQEGSGLGLATSYSIVRRHGGYLCVESDLGKGALFRVYLPAVMGGSSSQAQLPEAAPRGSGRILVMDDEKLVRDMASIALRGLGYDVDTANDGSEAVEKYRRMLDQGTPFNVMVLDLTISGGMGGLETLKILREMQHDVKAIVSSGYSEDSVLADPGKHGFCGVVAKPYRLHELALAVKAALSPNK